MGYRGHDDWRDMSDYVVHFTSGYDAFISILYDQQLRPGDNPLGIARRVEGIADSQRAVCFSEIPLDLLDRLVSRRSKYGIGFSKQAIVEKGGAPLWYLDKEGAQARLLFDMVRQKAGEGPDPDAPLWKLTPFVDRPGAYGTSAYRFEWEREWRVNGVVPFEGPEVAFIFLPEDEHEKARQFFVDVEIEHSGPAYIDQPYIDPSWSMDKVQDAIDNLPDPPEPSPSAQPWWLDPWD